MCKPPTPLITIASLLQCPPPPPPPTLQLLALGYILVPIFAYNQAWLVLVYALFMLTVATSEASARSQYTYTGEASAFADPTPSAMYEEGFSSLGANNAWSHIGRTEYQVEKLSTCVSCSTCFLQPVWVCVLNSLSSAKSLSAKHMSSDIIAKDVKTVRPTHACKATTHFRGDTLGGGFQQCTMYQSERYILSHACWCTRLRTLSWLQSPLASYPAGNFTPLLCFQFQRDPHATKHDSQTPNAFASGQKMCQNGWRRSDAICERKRIDCSKHATAPYW